MHLVVEFVAVNFKKSSDFRTNVEKLVTNFGALNLSVSNLSSSSCIFFFQSPEIQIGEAIFILLNKVLHVI